MEKEAKEMNLEEKEERVREAFIEYNKTGKMNDIVRAEMEKYAREDGDLNRGVIKKIIAFAGAVVVVLFLAFFCYAIKIQSKLLCVLAVGILVYCIFSILIACAVLKKRRKSTNTGKFKQF